MTQERNWRHLEASVEKAEANAEAWKQKALDGLIESVGLDPKSKAVGLVTDELEKHIEEQGISEFLDRSHQEQVDDIRGFFVDWGFEKHGLLPSETSDADVVRDAGEFEVRPSDASSNGRRSA